MKAPSALPVLLVACLSQPGAAGAGERPAGSLFHAVAQDGRFLSVAWNEADLRAMADGPFRVPGFPLREDLEVDLEVERFTVTGPGTRFVVGRRGAPDEALDFDPAAVLLLRGTARGRPGSHLFMALQNGRASGVIDLGAGGGRFRIASRDGAGATLAPGTLAVFRTEETAAAMPPGVPLCGAGEYGEAEPATSGERSPLPPPVQPPRRGLRQLELAVDTDHEYFILFGDLEAAAAYLVALYGAVSDIYMRDLDTRVDLTFARLWDDPDDLFNDVDPSPLRDFQEHWEANMGHVQRDAAQLLSGRRDYPFGGQAWVGSLCGFLGYSVVGYALGFFPDPSAPSSYHYDINITAHELGHSAGTHHTHDFPNNVDSCNIVSIPRQRGTIMSYCGETGSGMNANLDLYFHTRIRDNITAHLAGAACITGDCNANGIADTLDVDLGTSIDSDGNGVPDECEDCNDNAILDQLEGLPDRNANGIPDACEPDCNRNGRPDDVDIADRRSSDRFGNGVPDECEPDCNGNGVSDYTEIQSAMSLDIDRDARIDACQDCDHDSRPDGQTLNGAHGAWIASGLDDSPVRRFHAMSGVLELASEALPASLVSRGQDLIITPRRQVLVSSAGDHRVLRFGPTGAYLGNLAGPGAGGLRYPTGLLRRGDGVILVASRDSDSVLAFDENSGAFRGALVEPGSGGLVAPFGLALGPSRHLFVTSAANEVLEYNLTTGAFIRTLVAAGANGGLDRPRGLVFKPDGNLLVASFGNDELLEFDGQTGAPRGPWARVGTATRITRASPWGVRIGPNGNVFMVRTGEEYGSGSDGSHDHDGDAGDDDTPALHRTNAQIYEFDVRNGRFVRTYVGGSDHGLLFPTGFDFLPGWGTDCNRTILPDGCDIAAGHSDDADGSGVPDECETDCNGNGRLDRLDIIPFGVSYDCNFDLIPDECDIASGALGDCDGDLIPDRCDAVDGRPPRLTVSADPDTLWPPNHDLVEVAIDIDAGDDCGPVTVALTSFASSEPDDAPGPLDGRTAGDVQVAANGATGGAVWLRAERDGGGSGRTYTLAYTAVDAAGNATTAEVVVTVPHDLGGGL